MVIHGIKTTEMSGNTDNEIIDNSIGHKINPKNNYKMADKDKEDIATDRTETAEKSENAEKENISRIEIKENQGVNKYEAENDDQKGIERAEMSGNNEIVVRDKEIVNTSKEGKDEVNVQLKMKTVDVKADNNDEISSNLETELKDDNVDNANLEDNGDTAIDSDNAHINATDHTEVEVMEHDFGKEISNGTHSNYTIRVEEAACNITSTCNDYADLKHNADIKEKDKGLPKKDLSSEIAEPETNKTAVYNFHIHLKDEKEDASGPVVGAGKVAKPPVVNPPPAIDKQSIGIPIPVVNLHSQDNMEEYVSEHWHERLIKGINNYAYIFERKILNIFCRFAQLNGLGTE